MTTLRPRLLEYGFAGRPKPGERLSGDVSSVQETPEGVLLAVADGLGHGPEAAQAADAAIAALNTWQGRPVSTLMDNCHAALMATRGVALALAVLDANSATLTWLGVGNVEGRLMHRAADGRPERRSLLMHSGIVGHHLPNLHPTTVAIRPGDMIAMATDGIRSEFEAEIRLDLSPQPAAEQVLARYAKDLDDALILIGRWIGRDGRH
jgi:negative regulator of sigma-B (phosphoserine phosphatase)